jgi:hypothetical protein
MQHTVFAWYLFLQMMFSRHSIQKMHNGTTGEMIAQPKYYSTERRRYAENMRKRDAQNTNIGTYKNLKFFTRSYSSGINTVLCSQRVSLLLKKTPWYVLRGLSCPHRPLQIKMPAGTLVSNLNLLGGVWKPAANYNGCLARFQFLRKCANGQ